jgi:acyl-CoA reductase-like NAD-dependent aldehyde dehydrogenase
VTAPRLANYIGGAWVDAGGVQTLADVDPASGATVAQVPLSGATEVDAAVAAARAAQPGWREVSPQRRARAVLALREQLLARREELSALVSADMGKTLPTPTARSGAAWSRSSPPLRSPTC